MGGLGDLLKESPLADRPQSQPFVSIVVPSDSVRLLRLSYTSELGAWLALGILDTGLSILALNDPIPVAPTRRPRLALIPGGVPIVIAVGPQLSGLGSYSPSNEGLNAARGDSTVKSARSLLSREGESFVVPSTELLTVSALAIEDRTLELLLCGYRVVMIVGSGGSGSPGATEMVLVMLMAL
jgi:hypothetical protein